MHLIMQNKNDYLTNDKIREATRTIQALDCLVQDVYLEEHAKEFESQHKTGESDISEAAADIGDSIPGLIMVINGHGYRGTLSLFTNLLISCNRSDLAKVVIESKIQEE
jgi:hypothetical protein